MPRSLLLSLLLALTLPALAAHAQAPRPIATIAQDIDQRIAWIRDVAGRIDELARAKPTPQSQKRIAEIAHDLATQADILRDLQRELQAAFDARVPKEPPHEQPPVLPPPVLPPPRPIPPPRPLQARPMPMDAQAFAALLDMLDKVDFENDKLNLLRDAISSGARVDTAQAQTLVKKFTFGSGQVDAAALLCQQAIVTPGALPVLTSTLTFEADRQKLRSKVQGRCGL